HASIEELTFACSTHRYRFYPGIAIFLIQVLQRYSPQSAHRIPVGPAPAQGLTKPVFSGFEYLTSLPALLDSRLFFMKILVCDPISPKGIALLQQRPEFEVTVLPKRLSEAELLPVVKDVVALVVRSETKVTSKVIEAASSLRV